MLDSSFQISSSGYGLVLSAAFLYFYSFFLFESIHWLSPPQLHHVKWRCFCGFFFFHFLILRRNIVNMDVISLIRTHKPPSILYGWHYCSSRELSGLHPGVVHGDHTAQILCRCNLLSGFQIKIMLACLRLHYKTNFFFTLNL